MCVCVQLDTLTPSLAAELSDSASGPSPRVLSARQRKVSHGCSEGNTPKTPKSAVTVGSKPTDDRVFFPSNFSVERVSDLATMSRPTVSKSTFSVSRTTDSLFVRLIYAISMQALCGWVVKVNP